MKYVTYLVFMAFVGVTILFLKNALQPENVPVSITGTVKCGECHSLQDLGNQQSVWETSKHAAAFKVLTGEKSTSFVTKNGLEQADKNKMCLKCHTTANFLGDKEMLSSYNIEEGVGCESCHGAGSKYSPDEIMRNWQSFKDNGGLTSGQETCIKCHNLKGNKTQAINDNVCPFQTDDFAYKTSFEKIKHPLNKEKFR